MELNKSCPQLKGLDFSKEQIEDCIKNNSILRVSIALSKKCNLKCPFCYANEYTQDAKTSLEEELTFDEIKGVIIQAKENGAKTITLVGGEPSTYLNIKEIISFINSNHLTTVIFTNGTIMSDEFADFLYKNNVSLIVKFNSLDNPKIQDEMVGNIPGSFDKIHETISILQKTGFHKTTPTRLAIETVISKANLSQIPKIFRFARKNNIYPYIELITPAGRGKHYPDTLTKNEAKEIFNKLLKIDESEFGYTWAPRPPQVAATCKYYFTAVYINPDGKVQPCPTVKIELGNLKKEKLSEILNKPQTKKIRNIRENITGKCKTCSYHLDCYGCRGAAFNSCGDIFCEDPVCWI
jgi:radical SAM protein with 4Fe4S-binding SPASM domain